MKKRPPVLPVLYRRCVALTCPGRRTLQRCRDLRHPPPLSVGYASFPDLLSDVLNTKGEIRRIRQHRFFRYTSRFSYIQRDPGELESIRTQVNLQIPGINFTRVFTGPTRSNVEQQIKRLLRQGWIERSSAVSSIT